VHPLRSHHERLSKYRKCLLREVETYVVELQLTRVVHLGLPAYNEEAAIRPLFERIISARTQLVKSGLAEDLRVIFYNDGSTDGTVAEVRSRATNARVTLLSPETNGGLGRALQGIFSYFLQDARTNDVLIVMDSDDTHDPSQIMDLLKRMDSHGEDIVIASRYRRGSRVSGVPANRQILSLGFAAIVKLALPIKGVRDYSCGYRAYTYSSLKSVASEQGFVLDEPGFASMPEVLVRLRREPLHFGEVPLDLHYDQRLTMSKMRPWQNSLRLLKCLVIWRFQAQRQSKSARSQTSLLDGIAIEVIE